MQPSHCSVAREVGLAFGFGQFFHSFPRFWSGGSECGTMAGRMQVALGCGVLWPLRVPSLAWLALRRVSGGWRAL
eukprot:4728787-Pleurochrysis_carterae.AAC.1